MVKIQRIKHDQKKATTAEKIVAGVGVGSSLMAGGGIVSPRPPQTQFVSEQSRQNTNAAQGGQIKGILKNIFDQTLGVPAAQAAANSDQETEAADTQTDSTATDSTTNATGTDQETESNTDTPTDTTTDNSSDQTVEATDTSADTSAVSDQQIENTDTSDVTAASDQTTEASSDPAAADGSATTDQSVEATDTSADTSAVSDQQIENSDGSTAGIDLGTNLGKEAVSQQTIMVTNVASFDTSGNNSGGAIQPGYTIEIGGVGLSAYSQFSLSSGGKDFAVTHAVIGSNKITLTVPSLNGIADNSQVIVNMVSTQPNVVSGTLSTNFIFQSSGDQSIENTDTAPTDTADQTVETGTDNPETSGTQNGNGSSGSSAADAATIASLQAQVNSLQARLNNLNNGSSATGTDPNTVNQIYYLTAQIQSLQNTIHILQGSSSNMGSFGSGSYIAPASLPTGPQAQGVGFTPQGLPNSNRPAGVAMPAGYSASGTLQMDSNPDGLHVGAPPAGLQMQQNIPAVVQDQADTQNSVANQTQTQTSTYTVKKGDTLWSISKKYYGDGTKWRKILSANPKSLSKAGNTHSLKVGAHLTIPNISGIISTQAVKAKKIATPQNSIKTTTLPASVMPQVTTPKVTSSLPVSYNTNNAGIGFLTPVTTTTPAIAPIVTTPIQTNYTPATSSQMTQGTIQTPVIPPAATSNNSNAAASANNNNGDVSIENGDPG